MIDSSIAYKSIIMRCDQIEKSAFCELSSEVDIEFYKIGMENVWAQVQKSAEEFTKESDEQVKMYFMERYGCKPTELEKRCIFLRDIRTGKYIGTCMARNDVYGTAMNEYAEAMDILEKCMSENTYKKLVLTSVE